MFLITNILLYVLLLIKSILLPGKKCSTLLEQLHDLNCFLLNNNTKKTKKINNSMVSILL